MFDSQPKEYPKCQPKDYIMGRSDQVVYAIRAACILALVGVWLWAVINFAAATLEAMGKMG